MDEQRPPEPSDSPPPPGALPPAAAPPTAERAVLQQGPASVTLFVLLVCAALTSVIYRLLVQHRLEQGAALFVGLPLLLGTVIAFQTYPRSAFGMTLKVTALVLCVVAPLLGEGAICIAMAAPLIFGVLGLGVLIGRIIQRTTGGRGAAGCCGVLVALSPMLWDAAGKHPGWELARPIEEVEDALEVPATPERLWAALAAAPDPAAAPVPGFLQLRRRPGERSVRGAGLAIGAERRIRFDNDLFIGTVTALGPGRSVTFQVREGEAGPGERIGLWLRFEEVQLRVEARPGGARLVQRTRYRRLLDPGLYFGPLERSGVHAMHRYTLGLFAAAAQAGR